MGSIEHFVAHSSADVMLGLDFVTQQVEGCQVLMRYR